MPTHIEDLQSTVEIQADREPPATAPAPDETSERTRHERYQRDMDRLHADGYAD